MIAAIACASVVTANLQQPQTPADTPAYRFSEEQIRSAVPVRVGRKLLTRGWPNGAKVAVSLAFEMDAEASGVTPGELLPVPLSAREFGMVQGLRRVLESLDRHNVPATFFRRRQCEPAPGRRRAGQKAEPPRNRVERVDARKPG